MRYAVTHGQKSASAGNLVGTQAVRADINCLVSSADDSLYSSDVGLPCSVGLSVRVGNIMTECNALAADFALCHSGHLLFSLVGIIITNNVYQSKNTITVKQRLLL